MRQPARILPSAPFQIGHNNQCIDSINDAMLWSSALRSSAVVLRRPMSPMTAIVPLNAPERKRRVPQGNSAPIQRGRPSCAAPSPGIQDGRNVVPSRPADV